LLNAAKNPATLFQKTSETASSIDPWQLLNRLRNLDRQQLVNGAVVGAEVIGFFTVGQMIGRLKIIGYHKGEDTVAHH
jgi:F-type H+-transporting ATPase subunit g